MPALIDERGNKYGSREVLDAPPKSSPTGQGVAWLCRCQCGDESYVGGYALRRGKANQCHTCSATKSGANKSEAARLKKAREAKLPTNRVGGWGLIS